MPKELSRYMYSEVANKVITERFTLMLMALEFYSEGAGFESPPKHRISCLRYFLVEALCYKPEGGGFDSR
jgi:hypothetical protein